jgi:glyoxylase-like metal-dependent hydrolase (beta-lactamase superfamily II)
LIVHFLNCFTCNARVPRSWRTGTLCLLIDSDEGLILVDTGPGLEDYAPIPWILRSFQVVTQVPLDPEQAAVRQIARLGYDAAGVKDIILTHMHFDHCGGLPDFPLARVHLHRRELEAFKSPPRRWTDLAYVPRHIAHQPKFTLYEERGDEWYGFPAIRLPFSLEMWLVPLYGHSRGHCGLAVKLDGRWLFHMADAAPLGLEENVPAWLERLVLGPHTPRLAQFKSRHPEMLVTTSHMPEAFFSRMRAPMGADPSFGNPS